MVRKMAALRWLVVAVTAAVVSGCGTSLTSGATSAEPAFPRQSLDILAPAATGGGFDRTARDMMKVLNDEKLTNGKTVNVTNVAGAGGTTGLANFVTNAHADPHRLMVMGLSLVGGVITNKSVVGLDSTTTIAVLTSEYEVVAVSSTSKYNTLQDLLTDFKAHPEAVRWGGGAKGGPDHMLIGEIAEAVKVPPAAVNYTEFSGGDATTNLLTRQVDVIAGSLSEFKRELSGTQIRVLGVSAEQRVAGFEQVATMKESGLAVALANWRGVVAPTGISAPDRTAVTAVVTKMHASQSWQQVLKERGWTDFFKTGTDADRFVTSERERAAKVISGLGMGTAK